MTTYKKNDRRQWRHTLKRLQWRINYVLALLALLAAILVQPATANAAPRCPGGDATPAGCIYVVRGRPAVWPIAWLVGGHTAGTIDPEAQP